jgi:hypothetical protein
VTNILEICTKEIASWLVVQLSDPVSPAQGPASGPVSHPLM